MNKEQIMWINEALQGTLRDEMLCILEGCTENVEEEVLSETPVQMIYTLSSEGEVSYFFQNRFDETLSEEQIEAMEIALEENVKSQAMEIVNYFDEHVESHLRTGNPITFVYLTSSNGICTGYCTDEYVAHMTDEQKEEMKNMLLKLGAINGRE